jgi:uncharacterized protein (TIGR03437 family)
MRKKIMSLHSLVQIRQPRFSPFNRRLRIVPLWVFILAACSLGLAGIVGRAGFNVMKPQATMPVTTVSAASYETTAIAPDSIVAAFGTGLANQTLAASTLPQPTTLGGTTVEVNGTAAQLFFVSPGQVNFVIPGAISPGTATVVVRASSITSTGTVQISQAGPAIFSANADGQGVPAALLLRVKADGQQIYEQLAQVNPSTGRFVTKPIDLGPESDHLFLVLFLSGIRKAPDPNGDGNVRENVHVLIGGGEVTPDYAGAQPDFVGLDQINLEIPRGLIGRGKVNLAAVSAGFSSSNLGEIEIAGTGSSAPPVVNGFGSANVLAGQTLTINGSGFSNNMTDNTVRIGGVEAGLSSASSTQLSVVVPFGVESGTVSVRTPLGEGASASALPVRTSISGFVEDTTRQPMSGVTVKFQGASPVTTTTNPEGLFILPDVPAGAGIVEIDGTNVTTPPYPKVTLKMSVSANRDNQFAQPVAMQQATGPGLPVGSGGNNEPGSEAAEMTSAVNGVIETGGVTLDVPAGTALFPDGATGGTIFLTLVENSRTPTGLPNGFFSSVIAQITPFGVTLNPGGKLSFPNPDNLPAGTKAKLFRFDQGSGSLTIGQFIEAGEATVTSDGQRIETASGAITQTGIYFVSVLQQTTTIIGRVVESGGSAPVRRVLVRARGREVFTDGNGGFILRNVPVKPGEQISVEVSFLRANGRIERKQSNSAPVVPGGITIISPAIELPSPTANRPPVLLAPFDLTTMEGPPVADYTFVASDPDRNQTLNVTVTGAGFASVIQGAGELHTLRLSPGFNDSGSYTLTLMATDNFGLSTMRKISVTVRDLNRPPTLTSPGNQTVSENSPLSFTLSASDADAVQTLSYSMTNAPAGATLNPATGAFSYTPGFDVASQANPSATFNVTFTATDNGSPARSANQTISLTVNNLNRTPTATPQGVTLNEDSSLNITLAASDLDGDALTWTIVNRPLRGALSGTAPNVTYTPNLNFNGNDSLSFRVSDGLASSNEAIVTINVTAVNDPPALTVPGAQIVGEGQSLRFNVSATDVENNQLTLNATGVPAGATFDAGAGTFSWTPGFTQAGTYTVSFRATDNGTPSGSDNKTVTIRVDDVQHDLAIDPEDFTLFGSAGDGLRNAGDAVGASVAIGDLNGDGIPDLVVGAPGADGSGTDNGRVYVSFGKLSNGSLDLQKQAPEVILIGENGGDLLGSSVAIGDINGDGNNDLIIGAPGADLLDASGRPLKTACGKVYAVFGKLNAANSTIDKAAGLTIIGHNSNDQLGTGVATGRITQKDGPANLIVGAPLYDVPGAAAPLTDAGRVYLLSGGAGLTGTIDLANKPEKFSVSGQIPGGQIGRSLAIGDVNADGFADLAIGEPLFNAQTRQGAVYLVYGAATLSGNRSFGSLASDLLVIGRDADDMLGGAVATGDVNGDGKGDLIIGAPNSSGLGNDNPVAGEVYALFGSDKLTGLIDLAKDQVDLVIYGEPNTGDGALGLGSAIATGDFTGDGTADLAIGSPGVGPRFECGAVYLIPGAKSGLGGTIDLAKTRAALTIFGADSGDRIGGVGSGLAIGELNAATPGDLVIGIPRGDSLVNERINAGEVRILFGRIR